MKRFSLTVLISFFLVNSFCPREAKAGRWDCVILVGVYLTGVVSGIGYEPFRARSSHQIGHSIQPELSNHFLLRASESLQRYFVEQGFFPETFLSLLNDPSLSEQCSITFRGGQCYLANGDRIVYLVTKDRNSCELQIFDQNQQLRFTRKIAPK